MPKVRVWRDPKMDFLSSEVTKVTCWILPQKDAVYGSGNVEENE